MDNVEYYIQATGETVNGMLVSTPLVAFSCDYIKPDIFLTFNAENMCEEGIVRLSSNFVSLEGYSNPEDLIYIDNDKVQLLNGEKVWFNDFSVDKFACNIIVSDIPSFSTITTFVLGSATVTITWNWGNFIGYDIPMFYAELKAKQTIGNEEFNYILRSNKVEALKSGQQVFIYFRHADGMFDIYIQTMPKGTSYSLRKGGVR